MKTYTGGCHCGNVRYEVQTDLNQVISCNCSLCSKRGYILAFVPATQFTLQKGEDGAPTVAINVRCLDDVDVSTLTVTEYDGKNR
jgi:hypothetical protein